MYGASVGYLQQARKLIIVHGALDRNRTGECVDLVGLNAVCAVLSVFALMVYGDAYMVHRPAFAVCIHAKGDGGAAAERRRQHRVRIGTGVAAAKLARLVNNLAKTPGDHFVLIGANTLGFADQNALATEVFASLHLGQDITFCPASDDASRKVGVFITVKEMGGIIEADKALGMARLHEKCGRMVDADFFIARRVKDQYWQTKSGNGLPDLRFPQVFKQRLGDGKWTPAKLYLGRSIGFGALPAVAELAYNVSW